MNRKDLEAAGKAARKKLSQDTVRLLVDDTTDGIFEKCREMVDASADISPEDYFHLIKLKAELTELICSSVNSARQNIPPEYATYSDLLLDIENSPDFETVLYYEHNFSVVYDKKYDRFFYIEEAENDASDFFEVRLVATLSPSNELSLGVEDLSRAVDNVCCGEYVDDDGVASYLWFAEV